MYKRQVLPSIRKHGVYMSNSILDQVIQHPEVIYTMAQELVDEREQLEGCLLYTSMCIRDRTGMEMPVHSPLPP